ncbi:MAG: hypothetical protein WD609_04645, partial [Aquisalimonadaceae bacterium]
RDDPGPDFSPDVPVQCAHMSGRGPDLHRHTANAAAGRIKLHPGAGSGEYGDDHVRFGLFENEHCTRQALRGINGMLRRGVRTGEDTA